MSKYGRADVVERVDAPTHDAAVNKARHRVVRAGSVHVDTVSADLQADGTWRVAMIVLKPEEAWA